MRTSALATYQKYRDTATHLFMIRMARFLDWLESPWGASVTMGTSIAAVVLLAVLSSCQSLGVPTPTTFKGKVASAYTTAATLYDTTNTLAQAKVITANDARSVLAQIDAAKLAIDVASSTFAANPTQGQSKLDSVTLALSALQSYLTAVTQSNTQGKLK